MTHAAPAQPPQPPTPTPAVGSMGNADDVDQIARAAIDGIASTPGVVGARISIVRSDGSVETCVASDPCPLAGARARRRPQWLRGDTTARADTELLDRAGGRVGTLSVYHRAGTDLDDPTVALVTDVARQLGLAIEHLRLTERLQRAHAQLAVQHDKLSVAEQTWRIAFRRRRSACR